MHKMIDYLVCEDGHNKQPKQKRFDEQNTRMNPIEYCHKKSINISNYKSKHFEIRKNR